MDFISSGILGIAMVLIYWIVYGVGEILSIQNIFFFMTFLFTNLVHVYIYVSHSVKAYNTQKVANFRYMNEEVIVSQFLPKHVIPLLTAYNYFRPV